MQWESAHGGRPPTLIFIHIPKTGGTTLASILTRHYHPSTVFGPIRLDQETERDYIRHIASGDPAPRPVGVKSGSIPELEALGVEELERLQVLHGHFRFGVHDLLPQPSTYVTLLRRPVERVLSLYHHRVKSQGLGIDLDEYVRHARDEGMLNNQTYVLSGGSSDAPMQELFEMATRNLRERFAVVGTTDRFDETLLVLKRSFGWKKLEYVPEMVGRGRPAIGDVTADVIEAIEDHNRFDAELYAFAIGLLDEKVAGLTPPIDGELARFKERNTAYRLRRRSRRRRRRAWARRLTRLGFPGRAAVRSVQTMNRLRSSAARRLRRAV